MLLLLLLWAWLADEQKKVVERQADHTSCLDVDTINSLTESRCPSGTAWQGLHATQLCCGCTCVCLRGWVSMHRFLTVCDMS